MLFRSTYFHFLGFDIEKSASRTMDPDALADTNNPTLNNENCSVCHQTLDPLAGAYQNYGDEGFYRDQVGGQDSLPHSYKWIWDEDLGRDIRNELYQEGDSWYGDMRRPGFANQDAPNSESSLSWVAQQIAADDRFAEATIKFWWPTIFGVEAASAPQDNADSDYNAKANLFDAQSRFIGELATDFRDNNLNLKDLLVDMIVSNWFRAATINEELGSEREIELANVGVEKLLTSEELVAKTKAITGFDWGVSEWQQHNSLLEEYKIYFGGIDSDNVTERSREVSSIMTSVATAHAVEASCPIVINEFKQPITQRLLFNQVETLTEPGIEAAQEPAISADSSDNVQTVVMNVNLAAGQKSLSLTFTNDFWSEALGDRNLIVNHIRITDPSDQVIVDGYAGPLIEDTTNQVSTAGSCAYRSYNQSQQAENDVNLCSTASVVIGFAATAGQYQIEVQVYGHQAGDEPPRMLMQLRDQNANTDTNATLAIKQQIIQLHELLLGESLSLESAELEFTYQLFVDTWQDKNRRIAEEGAWRHISEEDSHCRLDSWQDGDDPNGIKTAWRTVITYLMMDYRYIHE